MVGPAIAGGLPWQREQDTYQIAVLLAGRPWASFLSWRLDTNPQRPYSCRCNPHAKQNLLPSPNFRIFNINAQQIVLP